jgi:hypothetical protein
MENYDDLAFKPELTWEELKNWVKSMATGLVEKGETLSMYSEDFFLINNMCFCRCGNVLTNERYYIAENKTPAEMQAIIEALWG